MADPTTEIRARRRADRTVFHVAPNGQEWQLKQAKDSGAAHSSLFATKKEAVDEGRRRARRTRPSQLIVHSTHGTIEADHFYEDPTRG
jgi:hypothetical protein